MKKVFLTIFVITYSCGYIRDERSELIINHLEKTLPHSFDVDSIRVELYPLSLSLYPKMVSIDLEVKRNLTELKKVVSRKEHYTKKEIETVKQSTSNAIDEWNTFEEKYTELKNSQHDTIVYYRYIVYYQTDDDSCVEYVNVGVDNELFTEVDLEEITTQFLDGTLCSAFP
jgi:hypothetical protein